MEEEEEEGEEIVKLPSLWSSWNDEENTTKLMPNSIAPHWSSSLLHSANY